MMVDRLVKVLLVEDNASHAELVRAALARASLTSFDVTHVASLAAARESLAARECDVVLLDLALPDASGLEGLVRIRQEHPDLAVVVLTCNSDPSLAVETASAGALDYVYKGDMTAHLLERVLRHAVQRQDVLLQIRSANESLNHKNAELEEVNAILDRRNEELRLAWDLLERKNQRLTQLNEMAQQFVDNVSHDFRTPLTVIKEYAGILRDGLAGAVSERQQKYLSIVDDRADDLAIMVDDMLDVSRFDAGLLGVWRRESRIHDILGRVCPILERKAVAKKVTLHVCMDEDLPAVYCDPDKTGRMITNLAVNAIKFCGEGGVVELWARRVADSPQVVIGVTDNGPGMSAENLTKIFQRFHRLERRDRAGAAGFGLGLSIAKDLAGLNLSEIEVESEPGKGSTFSFHLPVWDVASLPEQYLGHLRRSDPEQAASVTLILATVGAPMAAAESFAVDEFLQHMLRGTDFVLRVGPHKWLVLAQCVEVEAERMLKRVEEAWALSNRTTPLAPLPRIELEARGTWSGSSRDGEIIARCRTETASVGDALAGAKILVTDDDREFVEGLRIRLEAIGCRVVTAYDGPSAVETAASEQPDVILMEHSLAGMNGLEALAELRGGEGTRGIPVVILSASTRERQKALDDGARFYLQKPCRFETVAAALREAMAAPCPVDCG
jgi:signal transduction histidine kinase